MASPALFPIGQHALPSLVYPGSLSHIAAHSTGNDLRLPSTPQQQQPQNRYPPHTDPVRQDMRPSPTQRRSAESATAPSTSAAPKQKLVFINVSHPDEAREPANRKVISRTAMINRSRREQHSPPAGPPALPREDSNASSTTTLSPPETSSSWSTRDATSPDELASFSLPFRTSPPYENSPPHKEYFPDYTGGQQNLHYLTSQSHDFAEVGGQFRTPSATTADTFPNPARTVRAARGGRTGRGGRRPNGQTPAATGSSSQQLALNRRRRPQGPPPVSILSGAVDPFNSLPMPADAHMYELFYQYVNATNVSKSLSQSGPEVLERLKANRNAVWWPLASRSKAGLAALIAYLETTPELRNRARSPMFLQKHLDAALSAIGAAIAETVENPNRIADDSITFAIVLLMITAQRRQENDNYKMHGKMLEEVLACRSSRPRALEDTHGLKFSAADNGPMERRCLYCRNDYKQLEQSASRQATPGIEAIYRQPAEYLGEGFFDLINHNHLSQSMRGFIIQALAWNRIAGLAKMDRLSAAAGASHAWVDGSSKNEAKTPFDVACFFAARLCLYLSAWLDWNHSCAAVKQMISMVYEGMKKADLDNLLLPPSQASNCNYTPDAAFGVLWIALMAGPYTEGEQEEFFSQVLERAQQVTAVFDFQVALARVSERFLWTPTMTPAAEAFFWKHLVGGDGWGAPFASGIGGTNANFPPGTYVMDEEFLVDANGFHGEGFAWGAGNPDQSWAMEELD